MIALNVVRKNQVTKSKIIWRNQRILFKGHGIHTGMILIVLQKAFGRLGYKIFREKEVLL